MTPENVAKYDQPLTHSFFTVATHLVGQRCGSAALSCEPIPVDREGVVPRRAPRGVCLDL